MFRSDTRPFGLTIRGKLGATIVYGYHTAATFSQWTIAKHATTWVFRGTVTRADRFQLRQRSLRLSIPWAKGFLTWPIESIQVGEQTIAAKLRPPEA